MMDMKGDVYILTQSPERAYFQARPNTPLVSGDIIQTGADGTCDIALSADNLLHLEKGTRIQLARLDHKDSLISISFGSVIGKLDGLLQPNSSMEFRTPTGWGSIRGAEMAVQTVGQHSQFAVFREGQFAVHLENSEKEVLLTPNTEITVHHNRPLGPSYPLTFLKHDQTGMKRLREILKTVKNEWQTIQKPERKILRQQLISQPPIPNIVADRQMQKIMKQETENFQKLLLYMQPPEKMEQRNPGSNLQAKELQKTNPTQPLQQSENPLSMRQQEKTEIRNQIQEQNVQKQNTAVKEQNHQKLIKEKGKR